VLGTRRSLAELPTVDFGEELIRDFRERLTHGQTRNNSIFSRVLLLEVISLASENRHSFWLKFSWNATSRGHGVPMSCGRSIFF